MNRAATRTIADLRAVRDGDAKPEGDVGDAVAVRVDLELVDRFGRERFRRRRSRGLMLNDECTSIASSVSFRGLGACTRFAHHRDRVPESPPLKFVLERQGRRFRAGRGHSAVPHDSQFLAPSHPGSERHRLDQSPGWERHRLPPGRVGRRGRAPRPPGLCGSRPRRPGFGGEAAVLPRA